MFRTQCLIDDYSYDGGATCKPNVTITSDDENPDITIIGIIDNDKCYSARVITDDLLEAIKRASLSFKII